MVIQDKEILVDNNQLIVTKGGNNYPVSEMSDGERVIFYFIGQCLCARENSILIIDEPENHVHEAIRNQLWDEIEKKRPDCIFVYLTHDLEFAALRKNAKKICIRDYDGSTWDWFEVPETEPIPEEVTLKILGSRRPVVFIEREKGSLDCKIYSCIYQSYTVIPRGSCRGVIDSTSTFRKLEDLHHLKVFGIVDRDYRSDEEIKELEKKGIFVLSVAEIENILLTEGLIRQIVRDLREDNEDKIVDKIKDFIFDHLKKEKNNQVKEYANHRLNHVFKNQCFFSEDFPLENIEDSLSKFIKSLDINNICLMYSAKIDKILSEKNYEEALKILNKKNLFKQISLYFPIKSYERRIENFMKYKREEFIETVKDFIPVLEDYSESCIREN
jgi:predicted ATP-dependent endonuclease of OLD family